MELIQWSYTRKYQVKAIFSGFPELVIIFRSIGSYYFVFTSKGNILDSYPTRKDYVKMELLLNNELQTLPAYIARNAITEVSLINSFLLEKGLPSYTTGSPSS